MISRPSNPLQYFEGNQFVYGGKVMPGSNLVESISWASRVPSPSGLPFPLPFSSPAFRPLCPSFFISCSLCHASQNPRRESGERILLKIPPPSVLLFSWTSLLSLSLSARRRPTKGQGDAKIRPVVLGRLVEMNWKNSPAKDVLGLFSASI